MAYSTSNPPARVSGSLDNTGPGQRWMYQSADSDATVKAANYFSNAYALGMRVNDVVDVIVTGTGLYTHVVLTCTAAGACTVTQTPSSST